MDETEVEYSVRELLQRLRNLRASMGADAADVRIEKVERSLETFAEMLPVYEQFVRLLEQLSKRDSG